MTRNTSLDWLIFKTLHDVEGIAPCRFCGIQHEAVPTHPYCTMASEFVIWCKQGKRCFRPQLVAD